MAKKVTKKKAPARKKKVRGPSPDGVVICYPGKAAVPNASDLFYAWGTMGQDVAYVEAQVTVDGSTTNGSAMENLPSADDWAFEFDDVGGNSGDTGTITVQAYDSDDDPLESTSMDFTIGDSPPPV